MKVQHLGRRISMAIAAVMAGLWLVGSAHGDQIKGIVSFGDSLTDVGNYYAATRGVSPPTTLGYAPGLFTNGMNWVQYLAQDIGVAAPTASTVGGTNYAYGGAMTGTGYTTSNFLGGSASVPNMGQQISDYLSAHTPSVGQLYTIWGGANDVLNGGQTDPSVLLQNIGNDIKTLAMAGAKQFLVGNLPSLNLTPAGSALSQAQQAGLAQFTSYFNMGLAAEAKTLSGALGVQIKVLDVNSLFNNAIANPAKYGFNDLTDPMIATGNPGGKGFLFWDTVHPTAQADQLIGSLASQTVPEPSSLLLYCAAMGSVGCWVRRRRKAATKARYA